MKRIFLVLALIATVLFSTSCQRVAPNYQGVLMENFGKDGKDDFSLVKGRVNVLSPGTELFQVPLFEQRDQFEYVLDLKAANNTDFKSQPNYSYKVIENRAVDVVFLNKQVDGDGDEFMSSLADNVLEPKIYDIMKEASRRYHTDSLMAEGGQLKFEQDVEELVRQEFEKKGLELLTFSCQLEFSDKVKGKIDTRNEVNTNVSVIESQIVEQKKRNELEALKTEQQLIRARGLTPEILQARFIEKWDGKTPLYGDSPIFYKKTN